MNYYSVLGVLPSATDEEIKKAYRLLAKANHPDVNGVEYGANMSMLNEAYNTLKNPEERLSYDLSLKIQTITNIVTEVTEVGASVISKLKRADDTIHTVKVSVEDAFEGCILNIPNIKIRNHAFYSKKSHKEHITLEIPPNTLSGEIFIIQGRGGWSWGGETRSDLIIKILVTGSNL